MGEKGIFWLLVSNKKRPAKGFLVENSVPKAFGRTADLLTASG